MENKTPVIILIILLTIIIFFLVIFLIQYLCGGKIGIISIGTKKSEIIYEEEFKLEEINNIDIKQDVGNIILKEAKDDKIQLLVYGEKVGDIKVNLNHNKLEIDYTIQKKFTLFNFGSSKKDIILSIPSSYYNEIKIKNDLGNCEISNLENATLDIECNAGNVEVEKIKKVKIKCNMGEVKIQEIKNKCDIVVKAGNVQVTKLLIQEDSNIKSDLGNVYIGETNDVYIEGHVDLGNSNINGSNRNSNVTLKIECNCGNIKIGK